MKNDLVPGKRITNLVKTALLQREPHLAEKSNYFLQNLVVKKGNEIPVPRQVVKADRPTIWVFVDDAPLLNWAHPCRFLLHDAETGELYQEIEAKFPPFAAEKDIPKSFQAFHEPVTFPKQLVYKLPIERIWRPYFFGTRYAILFSGMSNNRHTNDLEFLYRTLIDVYGYNPANITVLNYDGTLNYSGNPQPASKWPGNNTAYRMPVHGSGSKANLLAALDNLKTKLKKNDSLLIHTNNHGGHNGTESDLCCYPNWDSLGVTAFTNKLAELPPFGCLTVMMEQCHSGGFNAKVISKSTANNTSIASACTEFNNSIGGADFDPFARDWIAAMYGHTPYGGSLSYNPDTDGSGRVSAKEAFDYANGVHDPYDTPVFHYANNGRTCHLGSWLWYKIPKFYYEKVVFKHWPEPDPLIRIKRLEAIQPAVEKLNKTFENRNQSLVNEYEKQFEEIIRGAKSVK